jgi:hypothetical protein
MLPVVGAEAACQGRVGSRSKAGVGGRSRRPLAVEEGGGGVWGGRRRWERECGEKDDGSHVNIVLYYVDINLTSHECRLVEVYIL